MTLLLGSLFRSPGGSRWRDGGGQQGQADPPLSRWEVRARLWPSYLQGEGLGQLPGQEGAYAHLLSKGPPLMVVM